MRTQRWVAFVVVVGGMLGVAGSLAAQEEGLVFAHRGGAHEFEENTLAAFRGSYEKGLRGFETDIRMTQDGELVILHDGGGNGVGSHLRRNETRRISVASLRLGPQCLDRFDRALYEDLTAFRADATASPGRPQRRRPDP